MVLFNQYLMVINVETIKIDKQGRLVIPASIRKALGISGEVEAIIRIDGNRIIIEPASTDLERAINEWIEKALSINLQPYTEDTEESWKWMNHEYAKRKLGISGGSN